MNWRLNVRPIAKLEIAEVARWYEDQSAGLASKFTGALEATLIRIQQSPLQYQLVRGELRRANVQPFPYILLYVVIDEEVSVVGCIHGRRNPRQWWHRT